MSKTPWFKFPGKALPKRLLRPFTYEEPISIDDKQYVILGLGDRVGLVRFLMIFPYVISLGSAVIWSAFHFNQPIAFTVSLASLAIALSIHYASKRMKHNQFTVFDREKGIVTFPKGWFSSGVLEGPWEEWSARLWVQSTSVGAAQHTLSIVHNPSYRMGMITASLAGIDTPLGYWSFLVQYMDKNAPLPDIPPLKDYPNRTNGLGSWKEWHEGKTRIGKPDPYYVWLSELKDTPELDEINTEIKEKRAFG